MKAEIVASGTELLLGQIPDTNTSFIANQLAILGIDLYYASIVGDNYERFLEVLQQARQRSDIIIITGGLGPTKGDITREVIAGLMGEIMEVDPVLKQHIADFFSRMHMTMTQNNLKQATLIPSATGIPNPLGTAPGWWVEKDGKVIIALPGPPGEMQPMWQKQIFPRLEKRGGAVILSRILKTWGLSEALLDQMVGPFMSLPNPTLALYAKPDGIQMRVTAKAETKELAARLIEVRESELRLILKNNIWGVDDETPEGVVSKLLLEKGLTISVAESFTGGFLAYSLSSVPESRRFFKGGLIIVDGHARESMGISSDSSVKADIHTASRMAALAREKFSADIGIGIDGNIEPRSESLTCDAFIAISMKQGEQNIQQSYPGRPYLLVRRSVMHSLINLKTALLAL
jgi:nicotinamide-nucleotide amidase